MDDELNNEGTGNDSLATPDEGSGDSGFNQAWAPLLDNLPEQFRKMDSVLEPLKSWDKNYQELQEKYKPYEALPEQFRDPETLTASMNLFTHLNQDPQGFLGLLAQQLGVSLAEAKEIVEESQEEDTPLEFNEDDDPRLVALAKQLEEERQRNSQFYEQYTQQEQAKIQQAEEFKYGQQIDAKVRGLIENGGIPKDQNGNPDQTIMKDLMARATFLISQGSKDPITDAFNQQRELLSYATARQAPAKPGLLFMPANAGAAPSNNPAKPDLSTANGRIEMARKIAEAAHSNG